MSKRPPTRMHVHSVFFYDETGGNYWAPADPDRFYVEGMAFVGPELDGQADAFNFAVCTPRWLADNFESAASQSAKAGTWWLANRQALLGRGMIFVAHWSRPLVEQAVADVFSSIEAPDWSFAADRAGRLLPWEFDYQHDEHVNTFIPGPAS